MTPWRNPRLTESETPMNTDSYISLYTYLFGWHFYGQLFTLLQVTGLWALPFVYILWKNTFGLASQGNFRSQFELSLRGMEFDVYSAIAVITLAFLPIVNIATGDIKYINLAGQTVTPDNNNTTYYDAFSDRPRRIRVPILWYVTGKFASGMNHAFKAFLPSESEARRLTQQLQSIHISDQNLQTEYQRFYSECYVPALSTYSRVNPFVDSHADGRHRLLKADARAAARRHGKKDVDWIGSRVFLETRGLYKTCPNLQACPLATAPRRPVPGWNYDWTLDSGADYAKPPCDEWWLDDRRGLRQKLLKEAEFRDKDGRHFSGLDLVRSKLPGFLGGLSEDEAGDRIIKRMLFNGAKPLADQNPSQADGLLAGVAGILGGTGAVIGSGIMTIIMGIVIQGLPIFQALLLFSIILLTPLALLLSGYSVRAVILIAVFYFTVSFWTALWAVCAWLDDKALQALYPKGGLLEFSGTGFTQDIIVGLATLFIYLIIPGIWTALMVIAGVNLSKGGMNALSEFKDATSGATSKGINTAGKLRR